MPQKKPSPAENAKKPPKAKAAPTLKKPTKAPTPAKKAPRKKAAPPPPTPPARKWRIASTETASPAEGADGSAATTEPTRTQSRALMVIPQPEPLTPWETFKAGMPASFEEFVGYIAGGGHLAGFVKERGIPYTTMLTWIAVDSQRSEMYARAREDRADVLADEIVAIADEIEVTVEMSLSGKEVIKVDSVAVQRNKLRVDARKWAASKLKPRTYGDKIEVGATFNHKGMSDTQLLERLAALGVSLPSITPQAGEASDDA